MKQFEDYLKNTVGLDGLYLEQAYKVREMYGKILGDDIVEMFVSEYVDAEGKQNFESVWVFTEYAAFEAKNFLGSIELDGLSFSSIKYWDAKFENFELGKADEKSRMVVKFKGGTNLAGTLKASGSNCDHLLQNVLVNILNPVLKQK